MAGSSLDAQIAAATAYEEFLVPALFGEWGPRLAEAARLAPGEAVLDVGCGTGVAARAAAQVVGSSGRVTGIDPNPGMLVVARRIAPAIEWREGAAETLPFPDASFDAVVSQFALVFFPDRAKAIAEMWRVLAPGGRLAVAVWASLDDTPAYAAEVHVLQRVAGPRAADALRAPFALGDASALAALFESAGVPSPKVTTTVGSGRFPSIRSMVETDVRGWLPLMGRHLDETTIATVLAEAERALAEFRTSEGEVRFDSPAHIVTAARPG